jgi:hypothetical protein
MHRVAFMLIERGGRQTAMYLMDHLENEAMARSFGVNLVDLPLQTSATIVVGNALDMDWNDVLPATRASYIYGNPPFIGKKRRTSEQQSDMTRVFGGAKGTGELDYVAAWYERVTEYAKETAAKISFVSTSSLVQGEQVPIIWPRIIGKGYTIGFAHRSFTWSSEARGSAQVAVVIVGIAWGKWLGPLRLFDYSDHRSDPIESKAKSINPYLADAPILYVKGRNTPLGPVPKASFGSMPNDGGEFLFNDEDAATIRESDPIAAKYLREIACTRQLLHGQSRWCLWLVDSTAADRRASPEIRRRVAVVQAARQKSTRAATRALADTPYLFGEIRQPDSRYLCVPRHSSENRNLIPMVFMPPEVIASDSTIAIAEADNYLFGVMQSAMFSAWQEAIGGKLEDRLRFSVEVVYNTFPFPSPTAKQRLAVANAAQEVLDARSSHPDDSLADLYDPLATPPDLVLAHRRLDRVVDPLFVGPRRKVRTQAERLSVLFERYVGLTEPD